MTKGSLWVHQGTSLGQFQRHTLHRRLLAVFPVAMVLAWLFLCTEQCGIPQSHVNSVWHKPTFPEKENSNNSTSMIVGVSRYSIPCPCAGKQNRFCIKPTNPQHHNKQTTMDANKVLEDVVLAYRGQQRLLPDICNQEFHNLNAVFGGKQWVSIILDWELEGQAL